MVENPNFEGLATPPTTQDGPSTSRQHQPLQPTSTLTSFDGPSECGTQEHEDLSESIEATDRQPSRPNIYIPSPLLVIPPLFLYMFGATLGGSPFTQFVIVRVCESIGDPLGALSPANNTSGWAHMTSNHSNFLDMPDYKHCAARSDVQAQAAMWDQFIALANGIPAFLLIPLMGQLVDRLGRKTLMVMPILSAILDAFVVIFVASRGGSLWMVVLSNMVQGFLGGYSLFMMCSYAFIGDTSTTFERTQTFLIVDVFAFIAFSVGPVVGGAIHRSFGILQVYLIILFMELSALAYVLLMLPESLKVSSSNRSMASAWARSETENNNNSNNTVYGTFFRKFLKSWMGCLDVLATPGRGSSLLVLALVTATAEMAVAGYTYIFFFYPAQRFGWDAQDVGIYTMIKQICRVFYLSVVLPILLRVFVTGKNLVSKTRAELTIIRFGYFMYAFGLACHAMASEGWMFYPLLLIYAAGTIAGPTIRGIVSRSVPQSSQGSLFASLELLQSGAYIASQLVLPTIYRGLVFLETPESMFYVQAGFWALALYLSVYLKSRELIGIVEAASDDEEEAFLPRGAAAPYSNGGEDLDGEMDHTSARMIRTNLLLLQNTNFIVDDMVEPFPRRSFSIRSHPYGLASTISDYEDDEDEEAAVVEFMERPAFPATDDRLSVVSFGTWLGRYLDTNGLDGAVDEISREMHL
ncbi:hypothetical protein HDU80_005950 [Chytriomyces hyalinus]|nr:hypothetical protein HDU80_005950 [Chytriomyces hyalinus]